MAPVATLAIGALAVGTAVKAVGDVKAANAQALAMKQEAASLGDEADIVRGEADTVRETARLAEADAFAADYNATDLEQQAAYTRSATAENERRFRVQTDRERGDLRTRFGKSGVTLMGSALDVLESAASTAELDALTIRHKGEVDAIGFENQAKLQRYRAASARASQAFTLSQVDQVNARAATIDEKAAFVEGQAKRVKKAGTLTAIGTALSGGASILGKI